ncbi:STAS domain-containing protein [Cellvibrio fibrivorans]|uniref:Anti-anti-sigma factor n=1 Tax=Cellvibrio fibrivorans TaxID=126350 RepID=A0ABU1V0C7_9GAMM|nr:STAS domain-containing protein [Cellvibrio fibrivorans]MDR7090763.1 anti-anti-sigma factor [Cellvibrio fibrivorans]
MSKHAGVVLPNKFDYGYHAEFQRQCSMCIDDATIEGIVFDFSRVEYLDSAALGMMLMWQRRAAAANKKMMIKGAKGATAQILAMANMQRIFEYI